MLYPLFFQPILKDKIWGGSKLRNLLNKPIVSNSCGESWEISTVNDNISIVENGELKGKDLVSIINDSKQSLLGKKIYTKYGSNFPLLIKFLDAKEDLSIQVHPDDEVAKSRHDSFGKTEMWYVCQADNSAKLISGFKESLTKESFVKKVKENTILNSLNQVEVNKGDVFYLPAGRVHTIGKGLLIAEIQQTSDITYRIYDFDREDSEGNKRELHLDEATEALNFTPLQNAKTAYQKEINSKYLLVDSPYFTTKKIDLTKTVQLDYTNDDQFKILMCIEGEGYINSNKTKYPIKKGETSLIPACLDKLELSNNSIEFELLEITAK